MLIAPGIYVAKAVLLTRTRTTTDVYLATSIRYRFQSLVMWYSIIFVHVKTELSLKLVVLP